METIQVQVSPELARQLRPYARQLPQLLELGLRQMQNQTDLGATAHRHQVREALQAAGLSQPQAEPIPPPGLLSAAQRVELGRRFATDRPLSDLIDEEREGR